MNNLKYRCVLWLIFMGQIFSALGQASVLQREISKVIRYESGIDFSVVPAILVGVMDGDSSYVFSYGEQSEEHDIFELGSTTKPIVAWLVDRALDSLGWSRAVSVCHILPDGLCTEEWQRLTISQILDHRSGLPRIAQGIGRFEQDILDPYTNYTVELFSDDLGIINPAPGMYSYSHVGYALFYWLFEKVGGLESFTRQVLNEPFSMNHTGWSIPDESLVPGHGFDGRIHPPWHTNALAPAFGLKSSLSDLLNFLKRISPETVNHIPQMSSTLKRELNMLSRSGAYKVVDGWFLIRSGTSLILYHTGRTGGHHVSIAYMPQMRKGVIVMANGTLGSNDLSLLVLNMLKRAKTKRMKK